MGYYFSPRGKFKYCYGQAPSQEQEAMEDIKCPVCSYCGRSFIAINLIIFHMEKGKVQNNGGHFVLPFLFREPKQ